MKDGEHGASILPRSGCCCSFLPPYILSAVAQAATDEAVKRSAVTTLNASAHFKMQRLALVLAPEQVGPESTPAYNIAVYDENHSEITPGALLCKDAKPADDQSAIEAFQHVAKVRDFYSAIFGRESVDGRGLPLDSSVHYGTGFTNALWTGNQMIYGDGDGQIYNRFTIDLDVIGHELTHGVVQHTCNLVYAGEPGALNEHLADVFGSMIKQYDLEQDVESASWLIGEHIFKTEGNAVRSMKAPGTAFDIGLVKDQQVASMSHYYKGGEDYGGVHINSGIPNRAFFLASTSLRGRSCDVLGKVWFQVMTDGSLSAQASFSEFAQATIDHANLILSAAAAQAVETAWKTVEVLP